MISYMGGIVLSPVKIACAILTAPRGGSGSRVPTATKKEVEPRATQPLYFLRCGRDSNPRLRGKRLGIVLSPVKIACAILTAPRGGMGSRVPTTKKRSGF